ncbi:hypothetical protein MB46_19960 (plasmid) [Arthrobacter alpinus]|nr:hypothetical protein MB46_19160 [Arthrobacter alpinus]ALV47942.1 hypothetical protein MB46_19960 [Arthrobacter alpinus]
MQKLRRPVIPPQGVVAGTLGTTYGHKRSTVTHEERLRAWAKGLHALVAATELLIRAYGGVVAKPGNPWVFDVVGNPDKDGIDLR